MNSPFVFDVADLLTASATSPSYRDVTGPSPSRIGPEMIAVTAGDPVTVAATLTPVGAGVLVDATMTATAHGECVRCLSPLDQDLSVHVSQLFVADPSAVGGDASDDADGDSDDIAVVTEETIDIEQLVVDEAVLSLPFNPTCADGCVPEQTDVPAPDGISGEEQDNGLDPRWAGLEKFR